MRLKKVTFVVLMLLILVAVFIDFYNRFDLRDLALREVKIEYMGDAKYITISDEAEINNIVELLDTKSWRRYFFWRMKCAPSLYLVADEIVIGFFDSCMKYCYVEINGDTRYYKVPESKFDQIYLIYKRLVEP
ncbi:MAG: hypothetical protein BGO41_12130 [Clostridiales bacterium 38-18]|nr:MAG: hypothetical protein BGO41_12130 [Clostridiales bacterium 38-18]